MELGGIMLSEISQKEKDKYRMISLICGIYKTDKIKHMNKPNQTKTNMQIQRAEQWLLEGKGSVEGEMGKGD